MKLCDKKDSGKIEWLCVVCLYLILAGAKIFVSFYMESPFIFSDEQSYFGMMDKIANLQFGKITNSHMPGYPLVAAIWYGIANDSMTAYRYVLIFNSIVSASVFPMAFYFSRKVCSLNRCAAAVVSGITSIASALWAYNYTVMAETLQTVLYFALFIFLVKIILDKGGRKDYICAGLIIGFLPIVKTQSTIMLVMFIIFSIVCFAWKNRYVDERSILLSAIISFITYAVFKWGVFGNVGMYEDQAGDNLKSFLSVFDGVENFVTFLHISFAEIAYLFVVTGVVPLLFVLKVLVKNWSKRNRDNIVIGVFVILFVLANIGVTILHAYHVYIDLGQATVYARYLDFLQPIFTVMGLVFILNDDNALEKQEKIGAILLVLFLCIIYPTIGKIDVNTYSVKFFTEISTICFCVIITGIVLLAVFLPRSKTSGYVLLASVLLVYVCMDFFSVKVQLENGKGFANTFRTAHYLALNPIKNEHIVLDTDVFGKAMKEDYTPGDASAEDYKNAGMQMNHKYGIMFWGIKNNSISQAALENKNNTLLYTNKLLMKDILEVSGDVFFYGSSWYEQYVANVDQIFRTCSGELEFVNETTLRTNSPIIKLRTFIPEVKEQKIKINFAENIVVTAEEEQIRLFINDIELDILPNEIPTNSITFSYVGEQINIAEIRIEFGENYYDEMTEGILYLRTIELF